MPSLTSQTSSRPARAPLPFLGSLLEAPSSPEVSLQVPTKDSGSLCFLSQTDLCSNTCPDSGAAEPSRGEETRFVHPYQPFMTSERLSGEAQSPHNSEGEEVGTAQVFPTVKLRGDFRNQKYWRKGAWCSFSGFMRNRRRLP